jgi:hypothetical protein
MRPITRPSLLGSVLLAGFALLFVSASARAQQPTPQTALLDHLAGHWVVEGTFGDDPVSYDLSSQWVMNHQYLRLRVTSHEIDSDGKPDYEATIFIQWDPSAKRYRCAWIDTAGISSDSLGTAAPSGNEIPFVFKTADGATHTTFTYNARSDRWEVQLASEESGAVAAPYVRATLTREP